MIKKIVIGGCGLVFVFAFAFSAFADQSIGYRQYFNEGVQAFKKHDDQKAIRCFTIAQIYDPADEELNRYLVILKKRGVVLELPPSQPSREMIAFRYYFSEAIRASQAYNDKKAIRYFQIAKIFNPDSKEVDRYLEILYQRHGIRFSVENQPHIVQVARVTAPQILNAPASQAVVQAQSSLPSPQQPQEAVTTAQTHYLPSVQPSLTSSGMQTTTATIPQQQPVVASAPIQPSIPSPEVQATTSAMPQQQPVVAIVPIQPSLPSPEMQTTTATIPQQQPVVAIAQVQPQASAVIPQPVLYVPEREGKGPAAVLSLAQITNNGQMKAKLQIEYHSSLIIEAKNIQRFLVVDDGFIVVKIIDANHLEVDAQGIGSTFLHIWDDFGLHTIYVEVIFPKSVTSSTLQAGTIQHGVPFKVVYSNDWISYYSGKNIPDLKRQSYDLEQTLAVSGETPYGFFDTSGSYSDINAISGFDTYTIGLSQIPIEGTSNFNVRGFDALRYLSPLTMPGTTLRGAFADVDLLDDNLGLSVSHGQEEETEGFIATGGGNPLTDAYIDAVKLTLFPLSQNDQYSFNYATAYGPDRPAYLTDHVYSVEAQHRLNDYLLFNAEEGSDSRHDSSLASLKWQDGSFRSGLNFRNIDKNYTTISTLPAYQGETDVDWSTEGDFNKFSESTFLEAYRDRLDDNPDNPGLYNYDADGHLRTNISQDFWSDSDINYVDTPGELSPTSSLGLDQRLSRNFGIWNSLKGTVFGGVGYQNSRSPDANVTDFDREDVVAGIQLPLTQQVSSNFSYEYDWLDQPDSGGNSNPSIINAGLEYQKQFTPKLSFNAEVNYHDELGVKANSNSFLSGEESVIITSGFAYNPTSDLSIFGDADASKVLSHTGNPSYDDFEVHLGVRITFGGTTYWDPLGTVSGIVFKDKNGDGKFVKGDEGIPGVKVKVGDKEATTDRYGRYRIQIRAKGVFVTPVLDSIPGGLLFSTPQTLNVRVFQSRTSHADFGLISQTGIYGIVFVSKNGSNVPSDDDKFIGKVKVILDGNITQKSDSHGAFYFRKVSPGQHVISIDLNTLELNMVPRVKLKNTIDVAEGTNYMFNIPVKIEKAETEEK